jgi:hypothetical protein
MHAGRAVETDLGVLPSLSKAQSQQPLIVCVETFPSSQSMLTFYLASTDVGSGRCYYRQAPPPGGIGNFISSTNTNFYAAARLIQGAPSNPVRCDNLSTIMYEVLTERSVPHLTTPFLRLLPGCNTTCCADATLHLLEWVSNFATRRSA